MNFRSLGLTALAAATMALSVHASPVVVPPNPVPTPPGVPSDIYRLVFVTSTVRDATSTNIADYNAFVNGVANAVPELAALHTNWYALASTAAVNLGTNTGIGFVPMYRLDGAWVASSIVNLNIGPLNSLIAIGENGNPLGGVNVWTGNPGNPGHELGTADVVFGNTTACCSFGLNDGTAPNTNAYHLYAVSGDLQLAPEPGSIALLPAGFAALLILARRSRKRKVQALSSGHESRQCGS